MIPRRGSYSEGFAPRDFRPMYPELWRGCVGAWAPCLGPTGVTLRDWSGFQNHGTLTNMDPGTGWVVSQGGYALDFDGSNDYVDTAWTGILGDAPRTCAAWIDLRGGQDGVIAEWGTVTTGNRWTWRIDENGSGIWVQRTEIVGSSRTASSQLLNAGLVCVMQTFGGGTLASLTHYLNGIPEASSASSAAVNTTSGATVQFGIGSLSRPFFGRMHGMAIWDRALQPSEAIRYAKIGPAGMYTPAPRRRFFAGAATVRRRVIGGGCTQIIGG